jgi:hypothetical protein
MDKTRIAELALQARARGAEFFGGGAESTSDFPAILANVANKTLRQATSPIRAPSSPSAAR